MTTKTISNPTETWFDDLVSTIRADQIQIETSIASKPKQEFYQTMIEGNSDEIVHMGGQMTSRYFISKILVEYVYELNAAECKPIKLAFYHTNSRVLVWAEIEDNDEQTEDKLLIAEAKVNAKYHNYGFHLSSTILEKCDEFSIPPQYQSVYPD